MSFFKVSKERVLDIKKHPNADKLEIAIIGSNQLVIKKGEFKIGDFVIIIPEKSVIENEIIRKEFEVYLKGPNRNRVSSAKIRGEISQGVIISNDLLSKLGLNINDLKEGEDISSILGIHKYEPPIPTNFSGDLSVFDRIVKVEHDVDNLSYYNNNCEFEKIKGVNSYFITEKIHGSQICIYYDNNDFKITSKGLNKKDLSIKESETNIYWKAFRKCEFDLKIKDLIKKINNDTGFNISSIYVFGEVIPCQKGFNYGLKDNDLKILVYRVDVITVDKNLLIKKFNLDIEYIKDFFGVEYTVPIFISTKDLVFCKIDKNEFDIPTIDDNTLNNINKLIESNKHFKDINGNLIHPKEGLVLSLFGDVCNEYKGVLGIFTNIKGMIKFLNDEYKKVEDENAFN